MVNATELVRFFISLINTWLIQVTLMTFYSSEPDERFFSKMNIDFRVQTEALERLIFKHSLALWENQAPPCTMQVHRISCHSRKYRLWNFWNFFVELIWIRFSPPNYSRYLIFLFQPLSYKSMLDSWLLLNSISLWSSLWYNIKICLCPDSVLGSVGIAEYAKFVNQHFINYCALIPCVNDLQKTPQSYNMNKLVHCKCPYCHRMPLLISLFWIAREYGHINITLFHNISYFSVGLISLGTALHSSSYTASGLWFTSSLSSFAKHCHTLSCYFIDLYYSLFYTNFPMETKPKNQLYHCEHSYRSLK